MGILYPFTGQLVSPELAALLMATSSISVTLNTLRMRGFVPAVRRQRAVPQSRPAVQAVG
jgi:Cu+-exporting ATPase